MELLAVSIAQMTLIAYMLWSHGRDRRECDRVIENLLQRIQAPDVAVAQHQVHKLPPSPTPLTFDDDEAFHSSREDLVELLSRNAVDS